MPCPAPPPPLHNQHLSALCRAIRGVVRLTRFSVTVLLAEVGVGSQLWYWGRRHLRNLQHQPAPYAAGAAALGGALVAIGLVSAKGYAAQGRPHSHLEDGLTLANA